MRKRIYRISEDKFDDLKPNIEFSSEEISLEASEMQAFEGSFSAKSTNGVSIRGVCYCSNPYVCITEPQFEGEIVNIEFKVDNIYAKAGESLEGCFTFLAVGIEKQIPFVINYVKTPLITNFGQLTSLSDFAAKAQGRFNEAVNIFYSESFSRFIDTLDVKTRLLYKGFRSAPLSPVNVDEFLVACALKPRMTFELKEETKKYYEVSENIKGQVEITRNTWGFIDIEVSSDADFVSVEKEHITADFFLGSVFTMNYYIHKEKMHAGKNYARICFDFRGTHKEIIIMATSLREDVEPEFKLHNQNKVLLSLLREYEDFRLRKISTGKWCKDTMELIDTQSERLSENMISLFKALLHITNKKRQEALWIIQDLKRTIEDKNSLEWAFLLYVCTLIEREESYVDRLTGDIEYIYRENPKERLIFWFLLQLRKEYVKNPTAKLRAIASIIEENNDSPLFYIEAYFVYIQDPYLISGFDEFTLKILNWARKHSAITRDIAIQMIHCLESQKTFEKKALPLLEACFEVYPDNQLLSGIVKYLLGAKSQDEAYLKWYRLAIEKNLNIPGLFEAYMLSMNSQSVEQLPLLILMFFRYNNDLPYDKKALLYANIILHKEDDPDIFKQYERTIENFAIDQLKLGHFDDNLAICYQHLLDIGLIDKEIARLICNYAFRKKVAVIYPNIRRVYLYQEEFQTGISAQVTDHQAYIMEIGSKGVYLLEDAEGHLIADEEGFIVEELMDTMGRIGKLKELCPQSLYFILEDLRKKEKATDFTSQDMESVELFLNSNQIAKSFKISQYNKLIDFLSMNDRYDLLEKHFMKEADLQALPASTVAAVMELLVSRSHYDEAYYMMHHTNCTRLNLNIATKICQYMINKADGKPEDFLISLTAFLLAKGKGHSDMIYYLVQNFVGPTDELMKIYRDGFESGIDMALFSERVLTQAIYRGFMPEGIIDIFDSYMVRKTNRMIVEAFITFEAHDYLSNQVNIPEQIFSYIFNRFEKQLPVNESMRIALLKFLCLQEESDEEELNMLDALLADSIVKNQYFAFFGSCDERLKVKYHLYDKHFVEFKGPRHKRINIIFSKNSSSTVEEEMIEMYDGIYVKQFVLFFGDELKYEIYCDELKEEPMDKGDIVVSDNFNDLSDGRFGLMNSISRHLICQDEEELLRDMKKYQGLEQVTGELFSLL